MRGAMVARSYAQALLALGERRDQLEPFGLALEELAAQLEAEPRLRQFLESPKIDPAEKKRVLQQALEERAPPLFLSFLQLLIDKRRQRLLAAIAGEYHALLDERSGRVQATVTLAREPDERMEQEIAADLSRILGKTVVPRVQVHPQILGGIVVRYGDRLLDGSLRRRLRALRRRLLDAQLPVRH
ncbi:MAG: ATP synthase F1 subunit delta [Gemmatimonadetes bacterium]|nr:ATP synthase F1 subunit delta [Gemmatimonadota bacterium]